MTSLISLAILGKETSEKQDGEKTEDLEVEALKGGDVGKKQTSAISAISAITVNQQQSVMRRPPVEPQIAA